MLRAMVLVLILFLHLPCGFAEKGPDPAKAVTAKEPTILPAALVLLVMPLTQTELEDEIVAWQGLVKKAVEDLAEVQLKLRKITAIEEAKAAGEEPPPEELLGPAVGVGEKDQLTEAAGDLLALRSGLLVRFDVVLKEFEKKGGDPTVYRQYARAVSGVKIDWTDPHSYWKTIWFWTTSEEGGVALAKRVGIFAAMLAGAYLAGIAVSWLFVVIFHISGAGSELLHRFVIKFSRRAVFLIGIMMGLSALGLNVTPLLAAIGATGFVVGMALQNTLSNVASGILIMTQQPFDVGDSIEAAGVRGKVDKVSLFSTHITTFDNSKLRIPNNSVWSNVITNTTAADIKRLDLSFDVKPAINVDEAEKALLKTVAEHPKVLDDPAPIVRMDELTDKGYKIICWPWVKMEDADEVRWDIIRHAQGQLRIELSDESAGK
jgi:small conductance mechanosensitive channel